MFVRKWIREELLASTALESIVICSYSGTVTSATFVKWINHFQEKEMKPISLYTFPDKDFHPSCITDIADAEENHGVSENIEGLASHAEEDLSPYFTDHQLCSHLGNSGSISYFNHSSDSGVERIWVSLKFLFLKELG
jgi:transposase